MLDAGCEHVVGDVGRILPMVPDGRLRKLARRVAMGECHRTQGWVAHRGSKELEDGCFTKGVSIMNTERHYEIVGMLSVDDGLSIGGFAGLKKQRVAAAGDG